MKTLADMSCIILTRNNNNFRCSIPYVARSNGIYSHVIELFRPAKYCVLLLLEMKPHLFLVHFNETTTSYRIGNKLLLIYPLFTDAPIHGDPIWHTLPQLHKCSAGK